MSGLPTPTLSASVRRGVTTNRIDDVRRPRGRKTNRAEATRRRPGVRLRARSKRYEADRSLGHRGPDAVVTACISIPPELLARVDHAAERRRKSRSHLIRIALEKLLDEEPR